MKNNSASWWLPSNEKFLKKYSIEREKVIPQKKSAKKRSAHEISKKTVVNKDSSAIKEEHKKKMRPPKIISKIKEKKSRVIFNVLVSLLWTLMPAVITMLFLVYALEALHHDLTRRFFRIAFCVIWIILAFGYRKLKKWCDPEN
jgi:hypothetical protein